MPTLPVDSHCGSEWIFMLKLEEEAILVERVAWRKPQQYFFSLPPHLILSEGLNRCDGFNLKHF